MEIIKKKYIIIFLLIYSMVSKLFTSFYSILFDTRLYYQDGAIFVDIGRMLMEGKTLYKETFDHKTPYIYFIYGLASIFKERHLGLYIIEVIFLFVILLFIYKTLKLFEYKYAFIVTLLLSLFLNSREFTQGFFKSETCALVALTPAIYIFAKYFISNKNIFMLKDMFVIGILAGFSFMTNIRAIILFVPFALIVAIRLIKYKEITNLFLVILFGLLGVIASILPYFIYALCTDSLYDFYRAVVYTNLAYNGAYSSFVSIKITQLKTLFYNDTFFLLYAFFSFVALLLLKFNKYLKVSIILSYLVGLYYILFTGIGLIYYFVIVVPYFAFGFILLINIFEKYIGKLCLVKEAPNFKSIFIAIVLILVSSINSYVFISAMNKNCIKKSDKLISIFNDANIDYKNKKLLGLGFEPMIYTTLDIIPKYKYFFIPNLFSKVCPEPFKGQVDYVMNLDPDIIILSTPLKYNGIVIDSRFSIQDRYRMKECIESNYVLIAAYDMDEAWGTCKVFVKK